MLSSYSSRFVPVDVMVQEQLYLIVSERALKYPWDNLFHKPLPGLSVPHGTGIPGHGIDIALNHYTVRPDFNPHLSLHLLSVIPGHPRVMDFSLLLALDYLADPR